MGGKTNIIPNATIEHRILVLRGQKVLLAADLAGLYGVSTSRLMQQVNRNRHKFPDDFMFQLTRQEHQEVVAKCNNLTQLKFSPSLPYVFTEHGAVMAASVLNSEQAVKVSILVVRAFVQIRQVLEDSEDVIRRVTALEAKACNQDEIVIEILQSMNHLLEKPRELEEKLATHEGAIREILDTLRLLIAAPSETQAEESKRRLIGFNSELEGGTIQTKAATAASSKKKVTL